MELRRLLAAAILLVALPIMLFALNGNVWTLVPGTATRQVDPFWQAWPTLMKLGSGKLLLFYHEDSSGQNLSAGTIQLKTSTDSGVTWTPWTGSTIATVTPTAIGSGYSSTPTCAVNANGAGSGATCTAAAPVNGAIPSISITGAGTGYVGASNYTCTISGGGGSGATCKIRVDLGGGNVMQGYMLTYGSGYTSTPTCTIAGGTVGTNATCTAAAPVNGAVTSYTFTKGSGYVQQPEVILYGNDGTTPRYAQVAVTVAGGAITALTLQNGGLGYSGTPQCRIEATTGSGATCTATFSGGVVTNVTLTAGGSGYQQGPTVSITSGGGSGATAAATLNYCAPTDRLGCLISNTTGDYRNVGGGITPAGTIFACSWNLDFDTTSTFVGDWGLSLLRSTDNGVSWSAPVTMNGDQNISGCTGGPLISIPSGSPGVTGPCATGCIAQVTRNDTFGPINNKDIGLYFSYDDGLTWPDRKEIPLPTQHTDETALAWLGGMTIIGFNRSSVGPYGPLYFINSSDLGTTWTINTTNWPCGPVPVGESGCTSEQVDPGLLAPGLPTSNLQTLIFGDRLITNAGGRPIIRTLTFDQNTAISAPTGFATPTQVFNGGLGPNINFSCYSATVQVSPNTVFVTFMQPFAAGTQSNLYFMNATYTSSGAPVPQLFAKANMVN